MSEKTLKTIDDLTPDADNFNRHTEFGQKLLEDSLRKFGAGRSILVDKDGNIIAGNGVVETAAAIGMDKIKVVETDGTELVVVKRKDLTLDSPEGRELALADNMTALKGIDIDLDKVQEMLGDDMAKAWGLDLTPPEVKNNYSRKVEVPIYEPTGEAVELDDLTDKTKYRDLLRKIQQAEIPEDIKDFLRVAATRHIVFNYERIGDYYANATAEVQELMEQSALVIIDFDKAIENGFVKLTDDLKEEYRQQIGE